MRGEFDSLRGNKNGDMTERIGTGLQNLSGRFDSYYHLNGFGGNPRIDDESMSTKTTERSRTKDGSYPTLEWSVTISRYKRDTGLRNSIKYGLPGPDGVMEAYLSYIQMAVVRFHLGVQKESKSRSDTAT